MFIRSTACWTARAASRELMHRVKELGQDAIAITDHGVMYGVIDFYKAAKAAGVKPIIGCEVYVAPRTRFDKVHALDREAYHLVLLCENETGYRNLSYMVSQRLFRRLLYPARVWIWSCCGSTTRDSSRSRHASPVQASAASHAGGL